MKNQTIEISTKTILIVLAIVVGTYFLIKISIVLILIFLAFIIMSAISPIISWMTKKHIPKGLSVLISILFIIALFVAFIVLIIAPIISQIGVITGYLSIIPGKVAHVFPFLKGVLGNTTTKLSNFNIYNYLFNNYNNVLSGILNLSKTAIGIIEGLVYFIFIIVMAVYMILYKDHFYQTSLNLVPNNLKKRVEQIIQRIESQLGLWLRGQILISLIIGFLFWLYLTILGVPYALPLALFAAFCEVVPFVGPIVSGATAVLTTLILTPSLFIFSLIAVIVIQQLEANFIAPKIMQKVIGMNPLLTIVGIFIGSTIGGLMGAIIVIPIVNVLQLLVYDLWGNELKNDHLSKNN
jgi:predicted PurR-regulated permease PerM